MIKAFEILIPDEKIELLNQKIPFKSYTVIGTENNNKLKNK